MYKICYTTDSRRHQITCEDYPTAVRIACIIWGLCVHSFNGKYHHPRMYCLTDGEWKENEEYNGEIN